MSTATGPQPTSFPQPTDFCPNPSWEVALLFPCQGDWTEADYLALDTNRLVELVAGKLEVLPMPSVLHQRIVDYFHRALQRFVLRQRLGEAFFAPLPVRIGKGTLREPDVIFISRDRLGKPEDKFADGADLVMEVVSPDKGSYERDYRKKRTDYAKRRIQEYWIVDPQAEQIIVLALKGKQYQVHGEFKPGDEATSMLLKGFAVDVTKLFAAGHKKP
ncbi:MAG TPA: Uma2 family endonuclease [Lacipirellulaceae bacterium]|nr:Uma2 family endonuclease [Lacipirellulaceae bacterium]